MLAEILLGILIGVVVFGGVILLVARHRDKKKREEGFRQRADESMTMPQSFADTIKKPTPDDVQVGWMFSHPEVESGKPQIVIGIVTYREEGYRWLEFFTENPRGTRSWISAEKDDETGEWQYVHWTEVEEDTYAKQGKGKVIYGETLVFSRYDHGTAEFSAVGQTNLANAAGTVDYADFRTKTDARLEFSLEAYNGGKQEASIGEILGASFVKLESPASL